MKGARFITAIAASAGPAFADGFSTWLWEVETDNGDAIVEPGETATVTLSMLMELDPGDGPFVAFCQAVFDVLGDDAAGDGQILGWDYFNDLKELTGDVATTDGVNIDNINTGQLVTFGPFASDNPIEVFSFHWKPDDYTPFSVEYNTSTKYDGDQSMLVWEGEDKYESHAAIYPVIEASIAITVVPAPACAWLLVVVSGARRTRRSEST